MTTGKNHDLATIAGTVPVAFLAYAISPENVAIVSGSFLFGGLFLSPDLDTRSRPYKRWSVLRFLWLPYQKSHKHRGVSHSIIFGSLERCLYLGVIVAAIAFLWGVPLQSILLFPLQYWRFILLAWLGIELSAWVHFACDGILLK